MAAMEMGCWLIGGMMLAGIAILVLCVLISGSRADDAMDNDWPTGGYRPKPSNQPPMQTPPSGFSAISAVIPPPPKEVVIRVIHEGPTIRDDGGKEFR